MANKAKIGLKYFPFEVAFFSDIKIRKLIKYQSGRSITVYVNLLCKIYDNGYYLRWDDELPFAISEDTGFEEGYINEVIKCCFTVDLLSKKMFEENRVLTSKGIQERYTDICKLLKRKNIVTEFILINSEILVNNSEELPQRKGKERKGKERKGKENKGDEITPETEIFSPPPTSLKNIKILFEIFSERKAWLTERGKEFRLENEGKVLSWMVEFNRHLEKNSDLAKTEKDYATHFGNWLRKQPVIIKGVSTSKNKNIESSPVPTFLNHYDKNFEKLLRTHPLHPEPLQNYYKHLVEGFGYYWDGEGRLVKKVTA